MNKDLASIDAQFHAEFLKSTGFWYWFESFAAIAIMFCLVYPILKYLWTVWKKG